MNLDSLNNISDFVLNDSLINNSQEVVRNIAFNAEPASSGWFGIVVLLTIYIFTAVMLYRDDLPFKLDFVQATIYSSYITFGIGSLMFVAGVITNFRSLSWIVIVFLISISIRYLNKQ